jgi:hypothetical protein
MRGSRGAAALAAAALLAAAVMSGCAHTDRPEGVVERWLISLNQGSAGRPDQYAPARVSDRILPDRERCDPGALDVVEVGIGGVFPRGGGEGALAPYRVVYASDIADLCGSAVHAAGPTYGFGQLFRPPGGDWSVVRLLERRRGDESLPLPSEGGGPMVEAPYEVWLVAMLGGIALCGLVALLMAAMPRPTPLASEPIDPSEARGL